MHQVPRYSRSQACCRGLRSRPVTLTKAAACGEIAGTTLSIPVNWSHVCFVSELKSSPRRLELGGSPCEAGGYHNWLSFEVFPPPRPQL
ncbi:hypothetical protein ElyMa_000634300 [Elysia marginata]|uniref:Uncharacterized protein n=1 Tax=Elysia marginata TaxID=1093978 RepID=A0AAV4GDP5_9GAST|nr:hypothetical protein ElyMa_000634300 [Elysia marginata]